MSRPFSYAEYEQIIRKYLPLNIDYENVGSQNNFALFRHDVEFNVDRALEVARLDYKMGAISSFLFQVRAHAYNIFSPYNVKKINIIRELKGHVGLHFYVSHIPQGNWEALTNELGDQRALMEKGLGFKINRFSFHRPPNWVLQKREDFLGGMINMYGNSFFEFHNAPQNIKYLADSQHRWNYGHPLEQFSHKKFQLLLHPDEWSSEGLEENKNFQSLVRDHLHQLDVAFSCETKNYSPHQSDVMEGFA